MREIRLPKTFDITAVSAVAAELTEALGHGDVQLDAGAVVKVDAAALQLLCAAAAAARAQEARLTWTSVPAVVADGAHTLALTDVLGLDRSRPQENR